MQRHLLHNVQLWTSVCQMPTRARTCVASTGGMLSTKEMEPAVVARPTKSKLSCHVEEALDRLQMHGRR